MKKNTLGGRIAEMRKEKGLTQMELAERMGVTDKAVSKWERDLSCPDIGTLPKLAEIFDTTVDVLMMGKGREETEDRRDLSALIRTILKAVGMAMGVGVAVLSALGQLDVNAGMGMLGLGLGCLGAASFGTASEE